MKATIRLNTNINALIERVFDLSRSIDLHIISTKHTGEQAIDGTTGGLIELGQTVTWRAKHFGIWQTLTSKITELNRPHQFTDEMVKGAFKSFKHEHIFKTDGKQTKMTDVFIYSVPFGVAGHLFNRLILRRYMTNLLAVRNRVIKETAEGDNWKKLLPAV